MFSKNCSFELEVVVLSKTFVAFGVIFGQAFSLRLLLSPSFRLNDSFVKGLVNHECESTTLASKIASCLLRSFSAILLTHVITQLSSFCQIPPYFLLSFAAISPLQVVVVLQPALERPLARTIFPSRFG